SVARVAPELAPEVVSLIDRALSWDPRNRFQSDQEMRAAIGRLWDEPGTGEHRAVDPRHAQAELLTALAEAEDDRPLEELSVDDQKVIVELQEIFTRVERSLIAVRQYTWEHKVTQGQFDIVHELIAGFLERH